MPSSRSLSTEDAYLPLRVLSAYAGLGVRTLRQYLQHPTRPLPHFRIGAKILVRRSEFDTWADGFRAHGSDPDNALIYAVLSELSRDGKAASVLGPSTVYYLRTAYVPSSAPQEGPVQA